MSWEEMSSEKFKCPCGNGTYSIVYFMDDWNRSDERWEMKCPKCKHNYRLYSYSYVDSGKEWTGNIWVTKEDYKKCELVENELRISQEKILKISKSRYLKKWVSYFQDSKSKTEIWRRLTDNGKRYPSLSTFYSHIKNQGIMEYLRSEFNYANLPTILFKLKITDKEINDKLEVIRSKEIELFKIQGQFVKNGFK